MEPFFARIFWITVIMLWAALLILYFILSNRESLRRKGHTEKYIAYLRRSHTSRIVLIAIVLPLLILLSGWIVTLITGPLSEEVQVGYIVVLLVLLVVPFKFVDERINQKRIKELALETQEKVVVDLNHKVLNQIFNPFWELALAPAAFMYGLFFLKIEAWVIYLFLLFPWFMYLNIRGTRYQTRPYLKDNYRYMFSFTIFNFLFFLSYFAAYFLLKIKEVLTLPASPGTYLLLLIGMVITLGLTIRTAIYLANYKAFNRTIDGASDFLKTPFTRKLVFALTGILLLFTMMGIGIFTGLVKEPHMQVGIVQEKYILQNHREYQDTLVVINKYRSFDAKDFETYFLNKDVKMSCKVLLSTTNQVKCYTICCPSIFKELPVGPIVKFEYGSGFSINKIID